MTRGKLIAIAAGTMLVMGAMLAVFFFTRGRNVTHAIFGSWYVETDGGPVVVVEHGSFWQASRTSASYGRPSSRSTMRLYSHRLRDGKFLGSFTMPKDARVAGMRGDRLWVCDKHAGAMLLQVPDLRVVADRKAIRAAVGGDFELDGAGCFVNPYSGQLGITKADGKHYTVSVDLHVAPVDPAQTIPPKGYHCNVGRTDLLSPHMFECLPPASAPVSLLAKSKASALRKDKKLPPLISGITASFDKSTVVWTKPLVDLLGAPATDVMWSGDQLLDPHKELLLVRTGKLQLHLIFLDPADGRVLDREVLFDHKAPGPG